MRVRVADEPGSNDAPSTHTVFFFFHMHCRRNSAALKFIVEIFFSQNTCMPLKLGLLQREYKT